MDPSSSSSSSQPNSPVHQGHELAFDPSNFNLSSTTIGVPSSSFDPQLQANTNATQQPSLIDSNGQVSQDFLLEWASTSRIAGESDPDPEQEQQPVDAGTDAVPTHRRLIWGTEISILDTINLFKDFLISYSNRHSKRYQRAMDLDIAPENVSDANLFIDELDYAPIYPTRLHELKQLNIKILNLDTTHLRAYPPTRKLYAHLVKYPHEIISIMDVTITNLYLSVNQLPIDSLETISVRPYNLTKTISLRALNPSDIDQLITINGLMIRSTAVIPDLKVGLFKCQVCHATQEVELDRGKIEEPARCPNVECNALNTMHIVHNRSKFASKQVAKLQETPDMIPDGQTPFTVTLNFYDDLIDLVKPGDRVSITGIFRSMPIRVNPRHRTFRSVFRTFVDAVRVKLMDPNRIAGDQSTWLDYEKDRLLADRENTEFTVSDQEKAELQAMSTRPDIYEYLSRSIAPSIYGMDDPKKGVLLQLFGGHHKCLGTSRYRGDINILLVGDPGVAKSQLLQYAHQISPRGVYTSGKGSSAVGLTASVSRDPDTQSTVLESGALVLSDGGICCIDEFDKMSDMTRSVLHEVMEQQTISIAKAGIITTLNARTSILASANPIKSKFDLKLSLVENINLVPSLLSRFDLVFVILDIPDEKYDRQLARHLVDLYMEDVPGINDVDEVCPLPMLTKYISYAKTACNAPRLQQEACDELVRTYVDMRALGGSSHTITATTRQLESMIRLAEAHAKLHLRHVVLAEDVKEAARLIREAIRQTATDPRTGRIDLDLIVSGNSKAHQSALDGLKRTVYTYFTNKQQDGYVQCMFGALHLDLKRNSAITVKRDDLEIVLFELQNEGVLAYEQAQGIIRVIAQTGGATAAL